MEQDQLFFSTEFPFQVANSITWTVRMTQGGTQCLTGFLILAVMSKNKMNPGETEAEQSPDDLSKTIYLKAIDWSGNEFLLLSPPLSSTTLFWK